MATKKKKAVKKASKKKTNPNGANQYQLDPRQKLCWDLYVNPKSETFGNAFKSAIKVGYAKTSAICITSEPWFQEKTRRLNLLNKAETVLEECLDMSTVNIDTAGYVKIEPALVKIKQDTAKFIAERVGKEVYSTRSELTGADGKDLMPDEVKITQGNDALKQYLNGVNKNTTGK